MGAANSDVTDLLKRTEPYFRAAESADRRRADGGGDTGLTAFIRFSMDDPDTASGLQGAVGRLAAGHGAAEVLGLILDEALVQTGAWLGNVQIIDPASGGLRIVAQSGFQQDFLDHFAVVEDDAAVCGRAAATGEQTVVPDVLEDLAFAPHRGIAAASGFRAVQSTPLVDADGRLAGMVSTHFSEPGIPSHRALRAMEFYGRFAGEALARAFAPVSSTYSTGADTDTDTGIGIGTGLPAAAVAQRDRTPASRWGTGSRAAVIDLADTVVHALFSAGLSLAQAHRLLDAGLADDRVSAAIDELDSLIGSLHVTVLDLHRAGGDGGSRDA